MRPRHHRRDDTHRSLEKEQMPVERVEPSGPRRTSPALVLAALACALAWPAPAPAGAPPPAALSRLEAGVEGGISLPLHPDHFGIGWGDARGFGAFVRWKLTPATDLVLRAERDRFPFAPQAVRSVWSGPEWTIQHLEGGDVRLDLVSLGVRVHHAGGALRAHAAFALGAGRRGERRMVIGWARPGQTEPVPLSDFSEPATTVRAVSFGVGLTWVLRRLPDPTVEARSVWLVDHERAMPLRVGLVIP
jgi:hypothetical protein